MRFIVLTLLIAIFGALPVHPQTPSVKSQSIRSKEELVVTITKSPHDEVVIAALLKRNAQLVSSDVWQNVMDVAAQKYYNKQHDEAFFFYDVARLIAVQLGDHKLEGITHYNVARSYSGLSDYVNARRAYLESEKAFRAVGLRRDLIYIWSDIATLGFIQENYDEARTCAENSVALAEQLRLSKEPAGQYPDDFGVAGALSTLGELAKRDGESRQAIGNFQRSLALYQKLNARGGYEYYIADVNASLGRAYTSVGDYHRGLGFLNKSAAIAKDLQRPEFVANLENSIGFLYLEQEDYRQASKHFEASLRIFSEQRNTKEAARLLLNLGVTQQRQNNHEQALAFFRQSLKAAKEQSQNGLMIAAREGIGAVLSAKGSLAAALDEFETALRLAREVKDSAREAEILWRMADVYQKEGKFDEAVKSSIAALQIADRHDLTKLSYLAEVSLGLAYKAQGRLELAIQTLKQAIAAIESSRGLIAGGVEERSEFFKERLVPYHELIEIYLRQGKTFESFLYSELAKGRVLFDALSGESPDMTAVLTTDEKNRLRSLNRSISGFSRRVREGRTTEKAQLSASRDEYQSFLNSVYVAHPELRLKNGLIPMLTAENLGSALDDDTAYLEYVVFDERVFLFLLRKADGLQLDVVELPVSAPQLRAKVNEFHDRLAQRHPDFRGIARELYELLFGPVMERIKGVKTVCIVPDNFLWNVPFQALKTRDDRYVIEEVAIYFTPSLSVLTQIRKNRQTSEEVSLLAIGNPDIVSEGRDAELSPLPEAEDEVRKVSSAFRSAKKTTMLGQRASERAFKSLAPAYSVIHMATHGVLDNSSPLYSYLRLAQTNDGEDDGFLEAREIMNVKLKADLAVLSGCETANGRIAPGEGVIGMSWAFFVAGTRSVVVSQWPVNSVSSAWLMSSFYRSFTSRNSKAFSVRNAALDVMRTPKYRHPFYWAAFVLVGQN